jgi:hypothetical protein
MKLTNRSNLLLSAALLGCLLLAACKQEADPYASHEGLDYFPLEVGKYVWYEVDSTIFDPAGDTISVRHSKTFVKEEVVDTLTDNLGNLLFRVERYERAADSLPWVVKKVFSQSLQGSQAIRTEDNLRFVKMTFPLRKSERWDGNIHFPDDLIITVEGETLEMFKGWSYKVLGVDEPFAEGDLHFDEALTVEEANSENLIELRQAKSVYARGIGLVYRELWILDTQCIEPCTGQTWEQKAEKGFILKQRMTKHN